MPQRSTLTAVQEEPPAKAQGPVVKVWVKIEVDRDSLQTAPQQSTSKEDKIQVPFVHCVGATTDHSDNS